MADKRKKNNLSGAVNIDTSGIEKATSEITNSFDKIDKGAKKASRSAKQLGKDTKDALNGATKGGKGTKGTGTKATAPKDDIKKVLKDTNDAWALYAREVNKTQRLQTQASYNENKKQTANLKTTVAEQQKIAKQGANAHFAQKVSDDKRFLAKHDEFIANLKRRSKTGADTLPQTVGALQSQMLKLDRNYDKIQKKPVSSRSQKENVLVDNYQESFTKLQKALNTYNDKYQKIKNKFKEDEAKALQQSIKNADALKEKSRNKELKADENLTKAELANIKRIETATKNAYSRKAVSNVKKAVRDTNSQEKADAKALADFSVRTEKETTQSILSQYKKREIGGKQTLGRLKEQLLKLQPAYDVVAKKTTALTPKEKAIIKSYNNVKKAVNDVGQAMVGAGHKQLDFLKNAVKWSSAYKAINLIWTSFKQGLQTLKEVDDALVNIRKVTDMTAEQGQDLAINASEKVSGFGRTVQDYLSAYEQFAKAGFRDKSLAELTELSLLLQNVGDITSDVANKTLIAANAGFKLGGSYEKLSHIIDVMNNISNNNAVTVEKMSEAITVSASVAQTAKFSFDEYMSIIGTASAVTQREGSVIGRAVRTIVANILKVNDSEADVDSETFAKAGKTLKKIADIDLTDTAGNLKSVMGVLTELAGKWETFNDTQRMELAGNIANKQQIDVFLGLMNNWTMVEKQLGEAVGSTGSALKENETYLDSITAKTNELQNAVTELWLNTIKTGVIKSALEFTTSLVGIIQNIGVVKILFVALTGIVISKFIPAIIKLITEIQALGGATVTLKTIMTTFTSWNAVALAVVGVSIALMGLASWANKAKDKVKDLKTAVDDLNDSYKTETDEITEASNIFKELSQKTSLTAEETVKLSDAVFLLNSKYKTYGITSQKVNNDILGTSSAQKDLKDSIGETTFSIDSQTTSIETFTNSLKTLTKQRLLDLKAQLEGKRLEAEGFGKTNLNTFIQEKSGMDGFKALKYSSGISKVLEKLNVDGFYTQKNIEETANILRNALNSTELSSKFTKEELSFISDFFTLINKDITASEIVVEQYNKVVRELLNIDSPTTVKALTQQEQAVVSMTASTKLLNETTAGLGGSFDSLNSAIDTLNAGENLTTKQIEDLIGSNKELLNYVDLTTGAFNIQASDLQRIKDKSVSDAKKIADTEKEKIRTQMANSGITLSLYKNELEGLKVLDKAKIELMKKEFIRNKILKIAQENPEAYARMSIGTWQEFERQANNAFDGTISGYNESIEALRKLIATTNSYTTQTKKGAKTAEELAREATDRIEASYKLIRDNIETPYNSGKIGAIQALKNINAEILKGKKNYDTLKKIAETSLSDTQKAFIDHYEKMVSMAEGFQTQIEKDYETAVTNIESTQSKVVDAIKAKYEKQRDIALEAIEAQRKASIDFYDLEIAKLEEKKRLLEDTKEADKENLSVLEQKLALAKLDDSVFGVAKQKELEKQIADLKKDIQIAEYDAQIADYEKKSDETNSYYDGLIETTNTTYDKMLEESAVYAEANKLIMSNNIQAIVDLIKTYTPDFAGVGQLLGKSMADGIKSEVTTALQGITTIKAGTNPVPSATTPSTTTTTPSTTTTTPTVIPWDGKNWSKGSSGATVKRIQKNLTAQGFTVEADGSFGKDTKAHVIEFQKKFGLDPDGIVGKNTWAKLIKFASGGIPQFNSEANGGVVYAHAKERILSASQTKSFDDFIYNFLPKLTKFLYRFDSISGNGGGANVQMDVTMNNNINSEFDQNNMLDNFNRIVKRQLFTKGIKV